MKKETFLKLSVGVMCSSSLFPQSIDIYNLKRNLEQWFDCSLVSLKKINGGWTNVSFVATNKKGKFVVRVNKKNSDILGIDRLCEIACHDAASNIGCAPKIVCNNSEHGILISHFIDGRTLSNHDAYDSFRLKQMLDVVKKCHAIPFKNSFKSISIWDNVRSMLAASCAARKSFLSCPEIQTIEIIIDVLEAYFSDKAKTYEGLCHNDLGVGNFINDGNQLWLIDWEYARWGNILFDLASLCVQHGFKEEKRNEVLKCYFGKNWDEHVVNFNMMLAFYYLNAALWYDLRGQEVVSIEDVVMDDEAHRYLDLFWNNMKDFVPLRGV